jgi:protein TonB
MRLVMLPLSIAAHVMAGLALFMVPLAAEVDWPVPAPRHPTVVTAITPVPPEVVTLASRRRVLRPQSFRPPPSFTPPLSLAPERESAPDIDVATIGDGPLSAGTPVYGGLPDGIGKTVATPDPPAVTDTPRGPRRVGGAVREPRKTVDVRPIYPAMALSARVEGVVILEAVINERGDVERVSVLKSVPLLDGAAVDAVSRWKYTPTLLNGAPVAVLMSITLKFTLSR